MHLYHLNFTFFRQFILLMLHYVYKYENIWKYAGWKIKPRWKINLGKKCESFCGNFWKLGENKNFSPRAAKFFQYAAEFFYGEATSSTLQKSNFQKEKQ